MPTHFNTQSPRPTTPNSVERLLPSPKTQALNPGLVGLELASQEGGNSQLRLDFGDPRVSERGALETSVSAQKLPHHPALSAEDSHALEIMGHFSPHMGEKYPSLGGEHRGMYCGRGPDGSLWYLPKRVDFGREDDRNQVLMHAPLLRFDPNGPRMGVDMFRTRVESKIPVEVRREIDQVMLEAERLGALALAAPMPKNPTEVAEIRSILNFAWAHSQDVATIMNSLGYPTKGGVHDFHEFVSAGTVKNAIGPKLAENPQSYSPWVKRFFDEVLTPMDDDAPFNIGAANPYLAVSFAQWTRDKSIPQDAMDIHRASDHHSGKAVDPVEVAVNQCLHAIEHRFGVHKAHRDPSEAFAQLKTQAQDPKGAKQIARSEIGGEILQDVFKAMELLFDVGAITPWDRLNVPAQASE